MMKTERCLDVNAIRWTDRFVDIVRNPYSAEDDLISVKSAQHATKQEITWAIVKLVSCLAVFVFCTLSARIASAEISWQFALMLVFMFAFFLLHCLAGFRLDESEKKDETSEEK